MKSFFESIYRGIWDAIIKEPYIPKQVVKNDLTEKPWFEIENKKA